MNPDIVRRLISEYNQNPNKYSDEQAEVVATLSRQMGMDFKRGSKPVRTALYGLGEAATFGLLPNSLRPETRGESVYGVNNTGAELLGNLVGGAVSGGLAVKGARGLSKGASNVFNNIRSRMGRTQSNPVSSVRDRVLQLGEGNQPLQLGEGQRLLSGQTNRQIRRNRFPLNSTSGQPIPLTSRSGQPIPMGGDIGLKDFSRTDAGRTYMNLLELLN
jgi:hypothetical protein|tara:strand:+ start:128 stop:778 length:651 start_codon:yes stop_codon:yes gene_type:complete